MSRFRDLAVAVAACSLLSAVGAGSASAASTPRLSLKVSGPTIEGKPFKEVAGTETTLTLSGTVTGKLPAGAKIRLGFKHGPRPLTLAKGTLKAKGGHVSTTVKSSVGISTGYQLVVISSKGRTIARSPMRTVVWIAPPENLTVSLYGEGAEIELPSGKLSCNGVEAGPGTCQLTHGGLSGNFSYTITGGPSIIGTPPGSTVKVYMNGAVVCEAHGPDGTCQNRTVVTTPAVSGMGSVTIATEYISPAGATAKVTAIVILFG